MGEKNSYRFFSNTDCEYFPCHQVAEPGQFNCLFCYCPLYALGEGCGGNFRYTPEGIKDCSACMIPHSPGGYDHITKNFPKLAQLARRAPSCPEPAKG